MLENPICKDPDYAWLWVVLLLKANHADNSFIWNGKKIICKRGQVLTSRKSLAKETGIQESKIERIIKYLKSEQQIEQQNFYTNRLITIKNYGTYQANEQQNEQQMNSKRTANEQQVNTNNNNKNEKNEKNIKKENTKEKKIRYGEFENIPLSEIEYQKLLKIDGEENLEVAIQEMSSWMKSKGKSYKNYYAALSGWVRRNKQKNSPPQKPPLSSGEGYPIVKRTDKGVVRSINGVMKFYPNPKQDD